jgi:hypothetical protein
MRRNWLNNKENDLTDPRQKGDGTIYTGERRFTHLQLIVNAVILLIM